MREAAGQVLLQETLGFRRTAGQDTLGDLALEQVFPEHPALLQVG